MDGGARVVALSRVSNERAGVDGAGIESDEAEETAPVEDEPVPYPEDDGIQKPLAVNGAPLDVLFQWNALRRGPLGGLVCLFPSPILGDPFRCGRHRPVERPEDAVYEHLPHGRVAQVLRRLTPATRKMNRNGSDDSRRVGCHCWLVQQCCTRGR